MRSQVELTLTAEVIQTLREVKSTLEAMRPACGVVRVQHPLIPLHSIALTLSSPMDPDVFGIHPPPQAGQGDFCSTFFFLGKGNNLYFIWAQPMHPFLTAAWLRSIHIGTTSELCHFQIDLAIDCSSSTTTDNWKQKFYVVLKSQGFLLLQMGTWENHMTECLWDLQKAFSFWGLGVTQNLIGGSGSSRLLCHSPSLSLWPCWAFQVTWDISIAVAVVSCLWISVTLPVDAEVNPISYSI